MDQLILQADEFTPAVIFDPNSNKFEISGESRPENAGKFYEPIIKWLEQYQANLYFQKSNFGTANKITFEFKFEYFNSTSAKYILDVLKTLDTYFTEGYLESINWYYDAMDEDMKESGEEFSKLVSIPFKLLEN